MTKLYDDKGLLSNLRRWRELAKLTEEQTSVMHVSHLNEIIANLEVAQASCASDYFALLVWKARMSADKAMRKYPQPNYVLLKVAEEAGEVVQAGVHYAEKRMTWDEVEGEIIQLLAMLIRLVTEGDLVNGVTPPDSCRTAVLSSSTTKPAPVLDSAPKNGELSSGAPPAPDSPWQAIKAQLKMGYTLSFIEAELLKQAIDSITNNTPAIPEGWKLVPEEPNLAMLLMLGLTGSFESMIAAYKNMLAGVPQPEGESTEPMTGIDLSGAMRRTIREEVLDVLNEERRVGGALSKW